MNGEVKRIAMWLGIAVVLMSGTWTMRSWVDTKIENHGHPDITERLIRIEERLQDIQKRVQ